MSPEKFMSYLTQLGEAFDYDLTTNRLLTEVWYEAMVQIPPGDLELALRAVISKFRFRPTPNEFLECYFSKKRLSAELAAWEEWKTILAAIKEPSKPFQLSGQAELALDALGGFKALGEMSTKDLSFLGKEFVRLTKMYGEAIANGTINAPVKKLIPARQVYMEAVVEPEPISSEVWAELIDRMRQIRGKKTNNLSFDIEED